MEYWFIDWERRYCLTRALIFRERKGRADERCVRRVPEEMSIVSTTSDVTSKYSALRISIVSLSIRVR